jgi:hypothetical protein
MSGAPFTQRQADAMRAIAREEIARDQAEAKAASLARLRNGASRRQDARTATANPAGATAPPPGSASDG